MGSATFFDAFDALSMAFVLPVLIGAWHLKPTQIGSLISVAYLGQVVGAVFFGFLAENIGRVRSASWTIFLMSIMAIFCAFAPSYEALFVLRFIQGIGVGGEVPVAATYINELSRAHGRGRFFMLYELIFPIGLLCTAQLGALIVPTLGWHWMFLVGGVPGLVIAAMVRTLPESPRWLIGKCRYEEAEQIIRQIEASTPLRMVEEDRVPPPVLHARAARGSVRELFSPFYRRRTFVVWTLWATAYFVANGLNNWLPSLYTTVYHLPVPQALRAASLSNVFSTVAVFACALLIDRVGRKRWALAAYAVSGSLLLLLWWQGARTAASVIGFGSSAYAAMGTVTVLLYLYTPEVYPTRIRAAGTALATSWLRLASAAGPLLLGYLLSTKGLPFVCLIFAGVALLGAIVSMQMIETSQRRLEDIAP
jgi:putative MFS transporter